MNERKIMLSTGVTLEFAERGAGAPVLIIPGYSDTHPSCGALAEALPARTIAITQRGHGDSDKPASGYAIADFAADAAALIDATCDAPAIVVGHSMGAAVALKLAAAHPEKVAGLVLIGAFSAFAGNPGVAELAVIVGAFDDVVDPAFVREFQAGTFASPPDASFLSFVVRESLKLPAHAWRGCIEGMLAFDVEATARQVRAPTLLVWGDGDNFCSRADQDALLDWLPGARLVAMSGVGHATHWERPAAVAAEIIRFLGDIGTDRTATRSLPVAAASFRT